MKALLYWRHSLPDTMLLLVHGSGVILSIVTYIYGLRLDIFLYQGFVVVQAATLFRQLGGRAYLAVVMGFCLTMTLLVATLVESASTISFTNLMSRGAYRAEVVNSAYDVLLGTTSFYYLVTLLGLSLSSWTWLPPDKDEQLMARRVIWPLVILSLGLFILTHGGTTILEASYASPEEAVGAGMFGRFGGMGAGLKLLGAFFLCFILIASARAYGYGSTHFLLAAGWSLCCTVYFQLLQGSRSGTFVVLGTLLVLFLQYSPKREGLKFVIMAGIVLTGLLVLQAWAYVRHHAYAEGLSAALIEGVEMQIEFLTSDAFDPILAVALVPASYWHLLYTVDLYDVDRIRLYGESFVNLIPQAVPSFIAQPIGWERPVTVAWKLGEYQDHGGGMFIIAEGYWNAGFPGALAVAGMMACVAIVMEHWARRQYPLLAFAYLAFLGMTVYGIFYALVAFFRALEVTIMLAMVGGWLMKNRIGSFQKGPRKRFIPIDRLRT